jgi:hypothetical protein
MNVAELADLKQKARFISLKPRLSENTARYMENMSTSQKNDLSTKGHIFNPLPQLRTTNHSEDITS